MWTIVDCNALLYYLDTRADKSSLCAEDRLCGEEQQHDVRRLKSLIGMITLSQARKGCTSILLFIAGSSQLEEEEKIYLNRNLHIRSYTGTGCLCERVLCSFLVIQAQQKHNPLSPCQDNHTGKNELISECVFSLNCGSGSVAVEDLWDNFPMRSERDENNNLFFYDIQMSQRCHRNADGTTEFEPNKEWKGNCLIDRAIILEMERIVIITEGI